MQILSSQFRLKAIGFALISRMFLMKQNGNFAIFLGGGMMSVSLCNNNCNRNINYNHINQNKMLPFFKMVILCSKTPLALRSHLDLVLSCTRLFFNQRSSFAILTTVGSEMRQWPELMHWPEPSFLR